MAEHVLVVDDEEPIREIVGSMLRRGGYEIQAVESGNQALATLRSGARFHLILTNLMMAELDGLELLQRVNVEYPNLPLVIMSSVHDPAVALACVGAGASHDLRKPFTSDELLAVVGRAIKENQLTSRAQGTSG